ncbi:Mediator of RNA polymerase II transcription subunit 21 [Dinochytrium kinnereticum]|nr:Mediator of RNA polymerase II transcription subunit 21 [Dinochytrium kinnereticum]
MFEVGDMEGGGDELDEREREREVVRIMLQQPQQTSTTTTAAAAPAVGDRLSQIQDCIDKITELFYTAVGVLQRDAPLVSVCPTVPVTAWSEEQLNKNTEETKRFSAEVSRDIIRTSKVIDFLIDKLPGLKHTPEQQMDMVKELERESDLAGEEMEDAITKAESLLEDVRHAIRFITNDQLASMKKGDY